MTATIEDVKRFWNDRPCNVKHSSKEIGTKEYFNEVQGKKFKAEPHILRFTDFPSWGGKKVLEIGCGLATVGANFAFHGADYTGVELSEEVLHLLRKDLKCLNNRVNFTPVMQKNFLLLFISKPMI